jgi:hypothetical protein
MYYPGPTPFDAKQLPAYLRAELERIAAELKVTTIQLTELHVEPPKPRDGQIVLADGTDWDPGSGAGFYGYQGGAWVRLG